MLLRFAVLQDLSFDRPGYDYLCARMPVCPLFYLEGNNSRASSEQACRSKIISMTIDLSVLEEEYEKMMHAPAVAIKPPASYSPATYPSAQRGSSMLSVCPTGLAALDCRALLNSSVEEIVCSPVALSHGFGSKSWPIASALC